MKIKYIILQLILGLSMGFIYYGLELLYDGQSHWSMICLGFLCGFLCGQINEHKLTWDMPLWKQILYGEAIVLPLEFISGCILNIWLKLDVWDYSELWGNILGQSSPLFSIIFIPVILFAIVFDDWYRYLLMNEEKPYYKLW